MDTQQEQVQTQNQSPIIDFSTILPNIPPLESQVVQESPIQEQQSEAPVNEFIVVDGEKVEVNLDEIIGNHPDGTPIKLRETDNPKSYKFFQARDSRNAKRLKEMEEKLNTQQPKEVKVEVKLEPPTRPEFPKRPKDYDPTEAVTDSDSSSYQYERMKEDYYAQRDIYDRYKEDELFSFKGQIEAEKAEQLKSKEELARQAYQLGLIQEMGASDINEAREVQEEFATPKNDKEFAKDLLEFHRWKKGQKTPQAQQKIDQFDRNGKRQNQYVLPPGVVGSQTAPENPTLGDELIKITKQYRI